MDILSILSDIAMLPWWFWALLIGVALFVASLMLATWWFAVLGSIIALTGAIGALWRSS
ncbi:hypothetical protein [Roseobacter sp. CCS2]|uniref:hypothetical protein n=1 Tax=Roseobacter sp. CCS2 TaxID=391593 RepID=UPI0000F40472|nr:hypothetical protein [Roseobacter sp. CCS2]EBA13392.1 hypothetical protein RCCS2_05884 [Roseobacter sp. CCS2]